MIGLALRAVARRRLHRLTVGAAEAAARQDRQLLDLAARAAGTRFGRQYDLAGARTAADVRARVPPQDYASLRPWFERARDGAADELWPGTPVSFVATAGSTGSPKFLPHTEESLHSTLRGALDALATYVVRARDAHLPRAPIGLLAGVTVRGRLDSGVPWGDGTGLLGGRLPGWLRRRVRPSPATMAIDDWGEKLEATAAELARGDLRVLVGAPSWCLRLLDRVEELTGRPIRDVWPSWRGLIHGGMSFAPYAATLRRRVGGGVVFVDAYVAPTGGVLAVQDREGADDLLLRTDRDVVHEFVPADRPDAPRVGLDQVRTDVPYLLHVTTDAGIWAYRVGDVVRFTGLDPVRIRLEGRADSLLNAFGENVAPAEMEAAIAVAAREARCEVLEFTVVPEFPRPDRTRGRHAWIVEFATLPRDLRQFAAALDRALQRGNDDYRIHRRDDLQLLPPRVRLAPRDAFTAWLGGHARLRGRAKVPRVVDAELAQGLIPGL